MLGLLGVGVLFTIAAGGAITYAATPIVSNANVQQAVANKDFDAFKKALIENATTRANNMTQDEFNKITERQAQSEAIKKAIEANDYEVFKKAADERMLEKVNSQDEFNKLVTNYKKGQEIQNKVLEAAKNNNFDAYKSAMAEQKQLMEANKLADANENHQGRAPKQLTDEQLKTRFDELVTYYKANNSLPQEGPMGLGGMGMPGMKGGRGGMDRGMKGVGGF